MEPKAFVSYSWTSPQHSEFVKDIATRLQENHVEVVLDVWELGPGHELHSFMERMVTDDSVTHVLIFCDAGYVEKANHRRSGVGTESLIISKDIYEKVKQSKFIPIVCEKNGDGPLLPVYLRTRFYIDFSSPELVNQNWEELIRHLFGKPTHIKPALGPKPDYILDASPLPPNSIRSKLNILMDVLMHEGKHLKLVRSQFLEECLRYVDSLRTRARPTDDLAKKLHADFRLLVDVRNQVVKWVLLEAQVSPTKAFEESLLLYLEKLLSLKNRPSDFSGSFNDSWFDAHALFAFNSFLHIIAALVKAEAYVCLHSILASHYLNEGGREGQAFVRFDSFYAYSETLSREYNDRWLSPVGEFFKSHADLPELPFQDLMQADLLVLMVACIEGIRWYPATLVYAERFRPFPLFVRAAQARHFEKLSIITGIPDSEKLRAAVTEGYARLGIRQDGRIRWVDFLNLMQLGKLNTLR